MQFQRQRCRPGLSFATDRARQWPVLARWSALVTRRDLATRTDSSVRCGTIQKQTTYRAMYSISIYLTCHVGEVYTWNMKKCIEHRYYQAKYLELKQTISFSRGWLVVKQEDVQSQECRQAFHFWWSIRLVPGSPGSVTERFACWVFTSQVSELCQSTVISDRNSGCLFQNFKRKRCFASQKHH